MNKIQPKNDNPAKVIIIPTNCDDNPAPSGINLRTGPPAGNKQTEMARTVFFTLTVFLRILAIKTDKTGLLLSDY